LKSKDETTRVMLELIKDLNDKNNIKVKRIRCDNSGENRGFQQAAKHERLGITFEFTARKTPQQNRRVERKFATLFGRVRAMMNGAGFVGEQEHLRKGLWAECAGTATKLENIIVSANKQVPAYKRLFGRDAPYAKHLRIFGEVGIVHDAKTIKAKLENQAKYCLFIGYLDDHSDKVYCMFNLDTRQVWTT